jgi:hypothetical protein
MSDSLSHGSITVRDLALVAGKPHRPHLLAWAKGATKVEAYVSFLFPEGVELVRDLLKDAPVDLTVSTYLRATRKAALMELLTLLKSSPSHPLRVRVATRDKDGFHGKVYRYTYGDGAARIVVGSANLSKGGLDGGGEVSLTVAGDAEAVPDLDGSDFAALVDAAWATAAKSAPLAGVIAGYEESKFLRRLGAELYSDVVSFVGVGETDDQEDEALEYASEAPTGDLQGELVGNRTGHDDHFIFDPALKKHAKWAPLARRLEPGSFVFWGPEGGDSLQGHRLLARYEGMAPPLDEPHLILFVRTIPGAVLPRTPATWRNRPIPREALSENKKLLAALAADLTTPETDE